jgi:hypothetical protein
VGLIGLTGSFSIATVQISNSDGALIKANLPASATIAIGVGTDSSVRWLLGEDDTRPDSPFAIRDMWNPRCFGNPSKVSDTVEYVCDVNTDGGGVHINSGVPNHGYALLVDGGSYNGQVVLGIGLTKAFHIYARAMSVYQVPDTDFADHADALAQSCSDLTGHNLPSLTTGAPSGQFIDANDCAQVASAARAVELRRVPAQCHFAPPLLAQDPPPLCPAGKRVSSIFKDNFNKANRRWTASHTASVPAEFTATDWQRVGNLPDGRVGKAFFGLDPRGGSCAGPDESGVLHLDGPTITLPRSATASWLTFDHWFATEGGFDGGNVKISVNGGPFEIVAASDFVYNAYNTTLINPGGSTNPMAGEPAFSGADDGGVVGSWGRSIINLAPYAQPRDTIRLRFDLGRDCGTGFFGWYLDDLKVFTCR